MYNHFYTIPADSLAVGILLYTIYLIALQTCISLLSLCTATCILSADSLTACILLYLIMYTLL